jgi:hypothetical protein
MLQTVTKRMAAQKVSTIFVIAITLAGMILTVTAASVISVSEALPMRGSISAVNVGLYSDSQCSQKLTSVDWGTLSPGETLTKTLYIKNTCNSRLTLRMTENNWDPPQADGPISITWNREGSAINAGQILQAVITLSVSSTISDIASFDVQVVITGTTT